MAISVPELAGVAGIQWYQADETGTETTKTIVLKGKATHGELFNDEILDSLRDSRVGVYGWYTGHVIRYGYGRQYDEIDITCTDLVVNYNKSGYYSRFEAQARTESRPLEEKLTQIGDNDETYATWWNHRVVSTTDGESITAADWKAQTDTTAPAAYAGTTARWVKTNQALKKGEYTVLEARFPGVQSYGVPVEQVKEIVYSKNEGVIQNIIAAVGYLKAPRDSANEYYDDDRTDASKWLITAASYQKRVGWWEAQVTFAYAKGGWLDAGKVAPATGVYPVWSS